MGQNSTTGKGNIDHMFWDTGVKMSQGSSECHATVSSGLENYVVKVFQGNSLYKAISFLI